LQRWSIRSVGAAALEPQRWSIRSIGTSAALEHPQHWNIRSVGAAALSAPEQNGV